MKRFLEKMPSALVFLLLVFAALPFWSLSFLDFPWTIAEKQGLATGLLVGFTYWVAPLLICVLLLSRNFLLLPVFALECIALIGHTAMELRGQPLEYQLIRYALLVAMGAIGVVIINKDAMYPFLSRGSRFWRKNGRIYANAKMTIKADGNDIPGLVQDVSLNGVGFTIDRNKSQEYFKGLNKGDAIDVELKQGSFVTTVKAQLVWFRDYGDVKQVGVSINDTEVMEGFIAALRSPDQLQGISGWVARNWVKSGFRRAVIAVWGLSIAGSFGMPACGTQSDNQRGGGGGGPVVENLDQFEGDEKKGVVRSKPAQQVPGVVDTNPDHGFGLFSDGPQPPKGTTTAWTGRSLACADGRDLRKDWSQSKLLAAFQGGEDWFNNIITSAQESHKGGVYRPKAPVHPDLVLRMNGLRENKDHQWALNLVKGRTNGRKYHLKINYEALVWQASAHQTVQMMSMIHAIAIPNDRQQEFADDLAAIGKDGNTNGCQVYEFIDKWIKAGSYWFTHVVVLDESFGPAQWVWTEYLPFVDEPASWEPGCSEFDCGNMGMAMMEEEMMMDGSMDMDFMSSDSSSEFMTSDPDSDNDGKSDSQDKCPNMGNLGAGVDNDGCPYQPRRWIGADAATYGSDTGAKLTIAPMEFQRYRWNPQSESLDSLGENEKVRIWFSGNLADKNIELVEGPNGETLPENHPAFQFEASKTCAQCHEARTVPIVEDGELLDARDMDFRHVGFGFERVFGVPRENNRAVFSPYLMATSVGHAMNGKVTYIDPNTDARGHCDPAGGCTGCKTHRGFSACLTDAVYTPGFQNHLDGWQVEFPELQADLTKFTKACVAQVNANLELRHACEFIRCAEFRMRRGDPLAATGAWAANIGPHNNPGFGCDIPDEESPWRQQAMEASF